MLFNSTAWLNVLLRGEMTENFKISSRKIDGDLLLLQECAADEKDDGLIEKV